MSMEQVTWELTAGLTAFHNLMKIVYEAAGASKLKYRRTWEDSGWLGVKLEGGKFYFGISPETPNILTFNTYAFPIDKEKADRLGIGDVYDSRWPKYTGPFCWKIYLDLDSEDVHFFARSKPSQFHCVEEFLKKSVEAARSIALEYALPLAPSETAEES